MIAIQAQENTDEGCRYQQNEHLEKPGRINIAGEGEFGRTKGMIISSPNPADAT
jgi:hypothetical protein